MRIIGIGSPNGDDRVGWHVAKLLGTRGAESAIEVVCLDRPGMRLLDYFADVECVVIIDAVNSNEAPGTLMHWDAHAVSVAPWRAALTSSHGVGVQEALALARTLGRLPPQCHVFGIVGGQWHWDAALSREVATSVVDTVNRVVQCIDAQRHDQSTITSSSLP